MRARTASGAGGDGEGQGAEDGPEDGPARRRIYDAVLRGDERTLLLNSINPAARTAPEGASATALVRSAATPKTLVGVLYEPLHFVRILLTSFDSLPLTSWNFAGRADVLARVCAGRRRGSGRGGGWVEIDQSSIDDDAQRAALCLHVRAARGPHA